MSNKDTSIRRLKSLAKLMDDFKIAYLAVDGIVIRKEPHRPSLSLGRSQGKLDALEAILGQEIVNDHEGDVTLRNSNPNLTEEGDQPLEITEEELLYWSST